MNLLKPNDQRAKNAQLMIWVILAMKLVLLYITYVEYNLMSGFSMESRRKLLDMATTHQVVAGIYTVLFMISGILFINWFRRAYYNLHIKLSDLSYSEGWAAGGWFIPILGLFVPYVIMKDLYKRTEGLLTISYEGYIPWMSMRFVNMWWALWIISNLLATVEIIMIRSASSIEELITTTWIGMIQLILGIPLALSAIKVIKDYASTESFLERIRPDYMEITETDPNLSIAEE